MSEPSAPLFVVGKTVKVCGDVEIEIKPWSIETLMRVTQRVPEAFEAFLKMPKDGNVASLLPLMIDEIINVVAETIGWEPTKLRREVPAVDVLRLVNVIWDECLAAPLAESMRLAERFKNLTGLIESASVPKPTTLTPTKPS